ncbi:hypothetical protein [Streptomyces sp. NPDC003480]
MTDSLANWLSQTGAELDRLLDVEGGLREILLHSDHEERVDDLDTILDEQAGLADILGPASTPNEELLLPSGPCLNPPAAGITGPQSLTPTERMRLRSTPAIAKAVECLDLVEFIGNALARKNSRLATSTSGLQLLDVVASAITKISDLLALQEGRLFIEDLRQATAILATMTPSSGAYSDEANHPAFHQAALSAVISVLNLMDSIIRQTLLGSPIRIGVLEFRRTADAGQVLNSVRHARNLLMHCSTGGSLPQSVSPHEHNLVKRRAWELEQSCLDTLQFTFEQRVGRSLPRLSTATLRLVLDDFTTADLSDADFQGVDMTGMRWSEHGTRWPATVDKSELRKISMEDPEGSGIYVIRFGTSSAFPVLAHSGQ